EQLRKQRTMMRFGFIAPFAILAIMATLAVQAGVDAMSDAEVKMMDQISQSDLAAARLVARIVDEQLTDQLDIVKREGRAPNLLAALASQSESDLIARCAEFTNLVQDISARNSEQKFRRWTLASTGGISIANWPPSTNRAAGEVPQQFSWRGWFNGIQDYYRRTNDHFPPLKKPYISQPF